jgi:hypothetical protein
VGRVALLGRPVALADLEDRDVVTTLPGVRGDHLEEAPQEALAHDRVLARERVGDAHDAAPGDPLPWDDDVLDRTEALDHGR